MGDERGKLVTIEDRKVIDEKPPNSEGVPEQKPTPYNYEIRESRSRSFDWNGWLEVMYSHIQYG